MTTTIFICLLLLASLSCFLTWRIYYIQKSLELILAAENDQTEINKMHTQDIAKIDVALINLINVPHITNELDPGYAKSWHGKVPFKMDSVFVGSEIKIADYIYKIDEIDGDMISIHRD